MIPKVRQHRRIDKSALAIGIPKRVRSEPHLAWIRQQRCCVPGCRHMNVEVHHLLQSSDAKGRSVRAGDDKTVPLCGGFDGGHHRGSDSPHHDGNERKWSARHGLDLPHLAETFWLLSAMERKDHSGRDKG